MASRTVSATSLATLLGPSVAAGHPAYRSIAEALHRQISDGRVMLGTRLPSERDLATALGVSRTTAARAYAQLRDERCIVTRRGAGSVASLPGGDLGRPLPSPAASVPDGEDVLDLTSAALPAAPGVAAAYERALEQLPRHLATTGYHPLGLPETRQAVADWYAGRGLPTSPDQVVITSGAHAAFSLVLRALLDPGDRVALETPTYCNAITAIRHAHLRPVGVPMLPQAWDVEGWAAAMRQSSPSLAYVIPDFQNPTGLLMDDETRERLARELDRSRTQLVVDETFVSLDLADGPMPLPLAAHSPTAISIGGVSKAFWGGLRVGWLRAPAAEVAALVEARYSLDLGTPVLDQLTAGELLLDAGTVLSERRSLVRAQRDAVVEALRDRLPQWGFRVPRGGINLWCELPQPRSSALVRAAERHGVWLSSGGRFGVEGGLEAYLRLPLVLPADEWPGAVERIAAAWAEALHDPLVTSRRVSLIA